MGDKRRRFDPEFREERCGSSRRPAGPSRKGATRIADCYNTVRRLRSRDTAAARRVSGEGSPPGGSRPRPETAAQGRAGHCLFLQETLTPSDRPCCAHNEKGPAVSAGPFLQYVGGVLLSHTVSHAVPSALKEATSGSGWDGVSPSQNHRTSQRTTPTKWGTSTSERPGSASSSCASSGCFSGNHTGTQKHLLRAAIWFERSVCSSPRPISTGRLHTLPRFISSLSTRSSTGGLAPTKGWENSSRGRLPRLDAFGGYPDRAVANQPCPWRAQLAHQGPSVPVLSYWGQTLSILPTRAKMGTERLATF